MNAEEKKKEDLVIQTSIFGILNKIIYIINNETFCRHAGICKDLTSCNLNFTFRSSDNYYIIYSEMFTSFECR